MSAGLRRGLVIAAVHVLIVASLGAKLLIDRAMYPRVWARAAAVDPNLPIRGRYVSLRVEVVPSLDLELEKTEGPIPVELSVQGGQLTALRAPDSGGLPVLRFQRGGQRVAVLDEPVAYFIPEHVADPSRRPAGEELWIEVTIPRRGPPRPIRLGVKTSDGTLTPLAFD